MRRQDRIPAFGRTNGMTKTRWYRLSPIDTVGCAVSCTGKSWRRLPSAGKRHDLNQVSFATKRTEEDGLGDLGF